MAKLPAYWVAKANMLPVHLAARAELRAHRDARAMQTHWVARVEQLAGN